MIADAEAKGLIKAGEVSVHIFLILMSEIVFVNPLFGTLVEFHYVRPFCVQSCGMI